MYGSPFSSFRWTALAVFAATIAILFTLQAVEQVWLHSAWLVSHGALSVDGLKSGAIWQLLTYAFFHSDFWSAALNILGLVLIGLPLQRELGNRAFATILALLTVAGGLAFCLAHIATGGVLLGATSVTVGILTLYCLSYPDRPITLLLFFVLPVTLLPKWVLWFTLAVNLFGFAFGEAAPGATGAAGGFSAALGSMLAAWAISRWCLKSNIPGTVSFSGSFAPVPPMDVQKKILFKGQQEPKKLDSRAILQKEVDRVLDKINTHGFGALNEEEKKILERAKDILGK